MDESLLRQGWLLRMMTRALPALVLVAVVGCGGDCPSPSSQCGGECDLIRQCGCPSGQWCGWDWNEEGGAIFEKCMSQPAVEPGPGEVCAPDGFFDGLCAPGSVCVTSRCLEICLTDEDCSLEGEACITTWPPASFDESHECWDYKLCTLP
jgi:hypothetical protein